MKLQEAVKGYEEQLLKSLQESIRIRSVQGEASEQYPYGKGVQDCLDQIWIIRWAGASMAKEKRW